MKKKKEKVEEVNLEQEKDINELNETDETMEEKFWDDSEIVKEQQNLINEDSKNNNSINVNNLNMPKKQKKSKKEEKEYEAKMLINYIGKNYNKILKRKFSFPAFFFGGLYLIYRKIYLLGMLLYFLPLFLLNLFIDNTIIVSIISILNLIVSIILGIKFNEKYSIKAYNDSMDINEKYDYVSDETIIKLCSQKGGTSIGLTIVIMIIISSVAIPTALLLKTIIFFANAKTDSYEKDITEPYSIEETITEPYSIEEDISEPTNSETNILSFNNEEYSIILPKKNII